MQSAAGTILESRLRRIGKGSLALIDVEWDIMGLQS